MSLSVAALERGHGTEPLTPDNEKLGLGATRPRMLNQPERVSRKLPGNNEHSNLLFFPAGPTSGLLFAQPACFSDRGISPVMDN